MTLDSWAGNNPLIALVLCVLIVGALVAVVTLARGDHRIQRTDIDVRSDEDEAPR